MILAITNQKGGVGKTTLAIQLAGAFARRGKILLIDMDAQGHLSSFFIDNIYRLTKTVKDVVLDECRIYQAINTTHYKNIDVLPSNIALSDLDAKLSGMDDAQYLLKDSLLDLGEAYSHIIIDCPPFLGRATRMSMVAATHFLIPIEAQEWAVSGANQLLSFVKSLRRRANPELKFLGLVINKLLGRRKIEKDMKNLLREHFQDKIFQTELKNVTLFAEANTNKKLLVYWKPKSAEAIAINNLYDEIMQRSNNEGF